MKILEEVVRADTVVDSRLISWRASLSQVLLVHPDEYVMGWVRWLADDRNTRLELVSGGTTDRYTKVV